jgi:hypothetical protein
MGLIGKPGQALGVSVRSSAHQSHDDVRTKARIPGKGRHLCHLGHDLSRDQDLPGDDFAGADGGPTVRDGGCHSQRRTTSVGTRGLGARFHLLEARGACQRSADIGGDGDTDSIICRCRFVSLYAYINPIRAVSLGTLLLNEPLTIRIVVAVAVIVAGFGLV